MAEKMHEFEAPSTSPIPMASQRNAFELQSTTTSSSTTPRSPPSEEQQDEIYFREIEELRRQVKQMEKVRRQISLFVSFLFNGKMIAMVQESCGMWLMM